MLPIVAVEATMASYSGGGVGWGEGWGWGGREREEDLSANPSLHENPNMLP